MDNSTVARAYAKAFYPLVEKEYSASREALNYVSSVLASSAAARKFLSHPAFSPEDKLKFLAGVAGWKPNKTLENLLMVLIEKKRVNIIDDLLEQLEKIYSQKHGLKFIEVISAEPLSAEQSKRLAGAIAKWLNKKVEVEFIVDKTRIAGFIIKDGERVLDNTILSELRALNENMLQ